MNQNIRKVQQCEGITLKNRQCKKRTSMTNLCWIHLAKKHNLRVKKSNISNAGKGLFAYKKVIPKNTKISDYTGRKLTGTQVTEKYGDGQAAYALCERGRCIDANYTTDAAARYANDAKGSIYRNNALLTGSNYNYALKAGKDIQPNEEILTPYGNVYWGKKRRKYPNKLPKRKTKLKRKRIVINKQRKQLQNLLNINKAFGY